MLTGRGITGTVIRGGRVVASPLERGKASVAPFLQVQPPTPVQVQAQTPPDPIEARMAIEVARRIGVPAPLIENISAQDVERILDAAPESVVRDVVQKTASSLGVTPEKLIQGGPTAIPVQGFRIGPSVPAPPGGVTGGHSGIAIQGSTIRLPVPGPKVDLPTNLDEVAKQLVDSFWKVFAKKIDSTGDALSGTAESKTISSTAQALVLENKTRRGVVIYNESLSADIRIKLGSQGKGVTATNGFLIRAGDSLALSGGTNWGLEPLDMMFYGAIYAIRTGSADVAVSVLEW